MAQPRWQLLCGFLIKKTRGVIPKQNEKGFVPTRIYPFVFFFLMVYFKSPEGGGAAAPGMSRVPGGYLGFRVQLSL